MRRRKWTEGQLKDAVKRSRSYRQTLICLGLKPAGGNYAQVQKYVKEAGVSTRHFTGQGWNIGLDFCPRKKIPLNELLIRKSTFQSYKLKRRLFLEGLKLERCEVCSWAERSSDGRLPLELNHINGDRYDNRLENLEILCPNCHSLRPNYRGKNRKK